MSETGASLDRDLNFTGVSSEHVMVLLPTYNNGATLEAVIDAVRKYTKNVFVVDDGSNDETHSILTRQEGIHTLRFMRNLGKGNALLAGLKYARQKRFTHVITMDTDGQHHAEDLQKFLEVRVDRPDTLFIGERRNRQGEGVAMPLSSRFGRWFSNMWVWIETGKWLADTQSGFRMYPVANLPLYELDRKRFDFEIEVLVNSLWNKIPAATLPVTYSYFAPEERVSHFDPLRDNARLSALHASLVVRRIYQLFCRFLGLSTRRGSQVRVGGVSGSR